MSEDSSLTTQLPAIEVYQPQEDINIDDLTCEILLCKKEIEISFLKIGMLFIEAKKKLKHGQWLEWLRDNVEFSNGTAERLMCIAEKFTNSSPVTNLGYTKSWIISRLPSDEIEVFVNELHEVDGTEKIVADMSKRELEEVVRKRKNELKAVDHLNTKTKKNESQSIGIIPYRKNTKPEQITERFNNRLEQLKSSFYSTIDSIAVLKESPVIHNKLLDELRIFCENAVLSIEDSRNVS